MMRKIIFTLAAIAGITCAAYAYRIWKAEMDYQKEREAYRQAAMQYVAEQLAKNALQAEEDATLTVVGETYEALPEPIEYAPITVDFEALLEEAPDAIGWLYCEGTNINYPVVQGKDNDQYLRHNFRGEAATAGSIFLESANSPGFMDSNNILYGHHMRNGTMFAHLSDWAEQEFYDEHPVMWLLTPEQDYKIVLFSGYVTPSVSDTYAVYQGPSTYFDAYLDKVLGQSDFVPADGISLERDARYVVLSTCNYTYQDARYALHGKLVPVGRVD